MSMEIRFQTAEGQRSPPTWLTGLVLPTTLSKKKKKEVRPSEPPAQ